MRITGLFNTLLAGMVMVFFLYAGLGCAQNNDEPIKVLWQKEFNPDPNMHYVPGPVTVNKPENLLIAIVNVFFPTEMSQLEDYPSKFDLQPWLWEIDFDGNLKKNVMLENVREDSKLNSYNNITDVEIFGDGGFIVFAYNRILKTCLNDEKTFVFKKLSNFDMVDLCRSGDNYFVVGSHGANQAVAIKINSEMRQISRKNYHIAGRDYEFFTKCVPDKHNNGFVGIGLSAWVFESSCFLLRTDEQGNELAIAMFDAYDPGSEATYPHICILDSGTIIAAMNYFIDDTRELQVVTRAYSPDLEELIWKRDNAGTISQWPAYFEIADISEGRFAIVRCKVGSENVFSVHAYDDNGMEYANTLIPFNAEIKNSNFKVVSNEDRLYVVAQGDKKGTPSKIVITALQIGKPVEIDKKETQN